MVNCFIADFSITILGRGVHGTVNSLYIYLAFRSCWIIPKVIPSVSWHMAKYPIPGIGILGLKTLPPSVEILLENSSTEDTSIVFVILPPGFTTLTVRFRSKSAVYARLAIFSRFYKPVVLRTIPLKLLL